MAPSAPLALSAVPPDGPGFVLDLPVPPSANNLFPGKSRRFKSPEYRAWLAEAGWAVKAARARPVTGPYTLELLLPVNLRGDVSNRLKATEDLLVAHGLTPDDRHCQRVSAARSAPIKPGFCRVIVRPHP
jgi:hypothetical protein